MFKVYATDKRTNKRIERKFSTKVMRDQMFRLWDKNPYMDFLGKENPAVQ